jgi:transcriptional regulator with XRE-family HTH domain
MSLSEIRAGYTRGLGIELKEARLRRDLSQSALATILGVTEGALSRWEHGNRNPSAENSLMILRWLQQTSQENQD